MAASTQNQPLSAILFLYREVLHQDLGKNIDAVRAKRPQHLPTVLTPEKALAVIAQQRYQNNIHVLNKGGEGVQSPLDLCA